MSRGDSRRGKGRLEPTWEREMKCSRARRSRRERRRKEKRERRRRRRKRRRRKRGKKIRESEWELPSSSLSLHLSRGNTGGSTTMQ